MFRDGLLTQDRVGRDIPHMSARSGWVGFDPELIEEKEGVPVAHMRQPFVSSIGTLDAARDGIADRGTSGRCQEKGRQVGIPGEGISSIYFARAVLPGVIKSTKKLHPASLPTGQVGLRLQVDEGMMISHQGAGRTLKVTSPLSESIEDS